MKLKPSPYAYNIYVINIKYYKSKNFKSTRQIDFTKNRELARKLTRRCYRPPRYTTSYNLYDNLDLEIVKRIYTFTDVYYSIFMT